MVLHLNVTAIIVKMINVMQIINNVQHVLMDIMNHHQQDVINVMILVLDVLEVKKTNA